MTRLEFLASLLGLGVGARALAGFDPAVVPAKAIPQIDQPRFAAYEFLQMLIEKTGIPAETLDPAVCILRAGMRAFGVDAHLSNLDMPLDLFAEQVIAPAASAMADLLRDEEARGARGLWFTNLCVPKNIDSAFRVYDRHHGYSIRYAAQQCFDAETYKTYWVVRFDILYGWRKPPRRPKQPFLTFDPARLPA